MTQPPVISPTVGTSERGADKKGLETPKGVFAIHRAKPSIRSWHDRERAMGILCIFGGSDDDSSILNSVECIGLSSAQNFTQEQHCVRHQVGSSPETAVISALKRIWLMPSPRRSCGVAVNQSNFYVVGGKPETSMNRVDVYNTALDIWLKAPSLRVGRCLHGVTTYDGVIYVAGGLDADGCGLTSVEYLDSRQGSWQCSAEMLQPRCGVALCYCCNRIFAMGGVNQATVESYHPTSGRWTVESQVNQSRHAAAVAVLNEEIYVIGGIANRRYLNNVDVYCPSDSTWRSIHGMHCERAFAGAVTHDSEIYVAGGWTGTDSSAQLEAYSPLDRRWQVLPVALTTGRDGPGVAVLGSVLG